MTGPTAVLPRFQEPGRPAKLADRGRAAGWRPDLPGFARSSPLAVGRGIRLADRRERPKDHLVAAHLAAGLSVVSVAERVGCHERTIRKRLEDSAFRAKVDALKAEIVGRAVAPPGRAVVTAGPPLLEPTTPAKS